MTMYDIICKKRNALPLTDDEIRFFISGCTDGSIPDYQLAALLMAICINGLSERETVTLTDAMAHSGDMLDLSRFGNMSGDKHSTGGVGDKTTLIVAPTVACLGVTIAKMSGRGLGHTGGTVDKLESIPGFRTSLSPDEFTDIAERIGVVVAGQSGKLTPADKKLYALRDVTATVDSIPLIASSIMSKKLASGAHNIVIDVKCGTGAFMKTHSDARKLAQCIVSIGNAAGRKTAALITDMNSPLGMCVGNSIEVAEAADVLRGKIRGRLYNICVELSSTLVSLACDTDRSDARTRVEDAISSGAAYDKFKQWIAAQGGNTEYIDDTSLFEHPKYSKTVTANASGYISSVDAGKIGDAAAKLGAGRNIAGESIDLTAGIRLERTVGDSVKSGDILCTLYSSRKNACEQALDTAAAAFEISKEKPKTTKDILEIIQ